MGITPTLGWAKSLNTWGVISKEPSAHPGQQSVTVQIVLFPPDLTRNCKKHHGLFLDACPYCFIFYVHMSLQKKGGRHIIIKKTYHGTYS